MHFKKIIIFCALIFSSTAMSESRSGFVTRLYTDPSDIVIVLGDKNKAPISGQCGSNLYHIKRSNTNFKEFYSLVLAAAAAQKELSLEVGGCANSRNVLTHGSVKLF